MEAHSAYIPMDRRQSLVSGIPLPNKTVGAALFADISGFTPLTEALLNEYGASRGAEELSRLLNLIYDALVNDIHQYGGSVLAFSGDAVTCWLDGDDGLRATACGLVMQQTMSQFKSIKTPSGKQITLAMKVGIANGSVRRYQIGDPNIQLIDALAGNTLDVMVDAEHFAEKGDVVVSPVVAANIADAVNFAEWRSEGEEQTHAFGVVDSFKDADRLQKLANPWPPISQNSLPEDQVRPWVLPPVHARLQAGKGEFLAELRPAVSLFLSFGGLEFDSDPDAGDKLDAYTQWVQNILVRYEGYLLQLTIGDKGCYLYSAFGAPLAHEDDAVRAVSAALELIHPPSKLDFIADVKIGISQGQMRTGAYGGTTRRTYGVLGDEVNMSARLMQAAKPGQVLIKDSVWKGTGDAFLGEQLPPFKVKGKIDPVIAYSITGLNTQQSIHLQEPQYTLPMVGRQEELQRIEKAMSLALEGHGQIVAVIAEAGMGKSRLVAEVIKLATSQQLVAYGGECQSYGTNISYLVWQPIWRAFFNLDSSWSLEAQMEELENMLNLIDPALVQRMPLLGPVLNLSIPDNDLTQKFDAKLRKTSLESLLVDCLRISAEAAPLMLVFEDCHWLDPLSHDLLEVIGRALADLPVLMVMAYRSLQLERLKEARLEKLSYFTQIPLTDFTPQEAERLIGLKLEQFFGDQTNVPAPLLKRITERAQGNPFYIEELLNYLQDQKFDPNDVKKLRQLDLPTSLHSLILSRIDQLTEHQKGTIKVASVIGRLFEAGWVWGMYPDLGEPAQIKADLEILSNLDLAPMDKPEPELAYIFKHVVTQEVAYESLPFATRAMLHDHLGQFIERNYSDKLDRYINLLAFHYGRSDNDNKKRIYLRRAGEVAQAEYNNDAAIDYYQRLLELLSKQEQIPIMLKLGEVLQLVGHWDEAEKLLYEVLALTEQLEDRPARAWCQTALGELQRFQSQYAEAAEWLEKARSTFEDLGDLAGIGQVLHKRGVLAFQQADYNAARAVYEESLVIRRQLDDQPAISQLLNNLGLVAHEQGDYELATKLYQESLQMRYRMADKWAIATSLNNLGYLAVEQGNYEAAQMQLEVALNFQREVGDRWEIATALNNLANAVRGQKNYEAARTMYEESLTIAGQLGDGRAIAYLLEDMGGLAALQGQAERAFQLAGAAAALREDIGAPIPPADLATLERLLDPVRQQLGNTAADVAMAKGKAMLLKEAIDFALEADSN